MKKSKFPFFFSKKLLVTVIISLFLVSSLSIFFTVKAVGYSNVTVTHTGNGSVNWGSTSPPIPAQGGEGIFRFSDATAISFQAVPDTNYIFAGFFISVNGVPSAESYSNPLMFNTATTDFTISAHFILSTIQTYRITVSHDVHTFVNPSISYNVNVGNGTTVYYSPVLGYQVISVRVDSANVAIVGYYSWSNIQANHAINIQSSPISQSNNIITFVNQTGGGISWTDYGQSSNPLRPINPTMGGNGVFGFPTGENLQIQAFPDSQNGYVFNRFGLSTDGNTETSYYLNTITGGSYNGNLNNGNIPINSYFSLSIKLNNTSIESGFDIINSIESSINNNNFVSLEVYVTPEDAISAEVNFGNNSTTSGFEYDISNTTLTSTILLSYNSDNTFKLYVDNIEKFSDTNNIPFNLPLTSYNIYCGISDGSVEIWIKNPPVRTNPFNLIVTESLTITAYFDFSPATNYTVIVSSVGNGQLTWHDSTTNTDGGEGINVFNVGDSVNFTSYAYEGSFRHGIFSTWGILGGMTNDFQVNLVINTDFNITAVFSDSDTNYTISMQINPSPLNYDLSVNTTNFILRQGIDYTATIYVSADNNNNIFGTYNISNTVQNANSSIVTDIGSSLIEQYLNWYKNNILSLFGYYPSGQYSISVLNDYFSNGNFQFIISTNGVYSGTLYQGVIINIFDELNSFSITSPIYTFTFLTPSQSSAQPTPDNLSTPTPTPISTISTINLGGGDVLVATIAIFGNISTDIVFVIFGVVCGLLTWKFALTGLVAGIGIATFLCTLAGLLPIWAVGLAITTDIVIIVLGSGLLNKTINKET